MNFKTYYNSYIWGIIVAYCLSLTSILNAERDLAAVVRDRAQALLNFLYDETIGVQQEAFLPDVQEKDDLGRIWVYTQGIALHQAARLGSPEAHKIADWLYDNAVFIHFEGREYFGGWHFSQNTYRDAFKDPRLITGASMWAMLGMVKYLTAPIFKERSEKEQAQLRAFYARGLKDLLDTQQREDGLFGAGWTRDLLKENQGTDAYYPTLEFLGYPAGLESARVVRAPNVVMEHNVDALAVLNDSIKHADKLSLQPDREAIISKRDLLRRAIFTQLYDSENQRFVTGLESDHFTPSPFTALDNAAWLMLAVNFEELTDVQKEQLARSLSYTIEKFVKEIDYKEDTYYGGHYFTNDFYDPYVAQSDLQEKTYHTEATLSLIEALYEFTRQYPQHHYTEKFQKVAQRLWDNCIQFITKHGFRYATQEINNLTGTFESATAAIWYIDVYDFLKSHGSLDS